ncbi:MULTISPECIES: 6-carboxytetrahydropterin synthase QueD [Paenibacillus]|uniref:6-carboxy-5,6,7,8-tetrahydropterin synthase n=1 Tax=Paenibacillus campinasensis TaxID=66347 RepID=A0A268EDM1_9BACL|nr:MULTISPECIES: 6-carboxytetrahydropterin synthase QueD [Paenibacillus]MUG67896.1 6-carboxytetrahydropterin synthase QueD [Paenibacillus campinasensis]PAD71180.1 6-carboxytetrahydropterin synthase QueD [Paenibacillus campinasensis]PAK49713.1 6-carboxytetrahydropterin synthase QueD [Paenibacillus sp. 7541]
MSRQPGEFRIVDRLQELGKDIDAGSLRYHRKRVLVSKEFTFDAAHHLHAYEGKCKNLHGHTYIVVFGISGMPDDVGITVDFAQIKHIWKTEIEPFLDHRYLNETLPPMNTTAENMVVWLFEQMEAALVKNEAYQRQGLRTEFVRLFETPTSYAEVRREWMEHE